MQICNILLYLPEGGPSPPFYMVGAHTSQHPPKHNPLPCHGEILAALANEPAATMVALRAMGGEDEIAGLAGPP